MSNASPLIRRIGLTVALLLQAWATSAQTTVRGVVVDAKTREPLPFVSILFIGTNVGAVTDFDGKYFIQCPASETCSRLLFKTLGYKTEERTVQVAPASVINLEMQVEALTLDEFEVKAGKRKRYRNRDNPAVDLVRAVIAHKDSNRMQAHDQLQYEEYEKLQMAMSGISEKFRNRKIMRKYAFLFENMDTTKVEGKAVLPIYLKETMTDRYWNRDPERSKAVVKAEKHVSFEEYIDDQGVISYLNYLYSDIDLYANNIQVLTNMFLSPIADAAPLFYEFFITDTVVSGKERLVELSFVPRNTTDFLFQGHILVSLDGRYTVRKVSMGVNRKINLNWVRELHIDQRFQRDSTGRYPMVFSRMRADFGISKGGSGIYGERSVSLRNIQVDHALPAEFYKAQVTDSLHVDEPDDGFWVEHRHEPLTQAESKVYQNVDSLKRMPSFRRTMDIATLLLAGYKGFGWWELGPVNTFYSFNPVEGLRLRAGGRTTTNFSERLYFEGYGAYGFTDERWKYFGSATWSLSGRSIWRFPVHSLKLSYQTDTKIPGQELQFVQEDVFLLSFKRGINDKWTYNDIWNVEYWREFESHFSFKLGLMNWRQVAAGGLHFIAGGEPVDASSIPQEVEVITSEVTAELRWAPNEKFFQGKLYRTPMPNAYPILTLRIAQGIEGAWDGGYDYTSARFNLFKRFYFSQFGYVDLNAEAGYIAGQVPYPLLMIHRANQTYSYQLQSYNLMNFLEFVSDHYASMHLQYYLNGALFNKVPLFRRLKWREVVSFKALYGGLRKENDPGHNEEQMPFPTDDLGHTTTWSLADGPYMEGSVGIANIFKLFRVDLVRRFSYLEHPNAPEWGVRVRFKLDF
ncbi:MAG: carboxypeptidase-like regulatory domain-containing protein [Flavobacteriales bacterium]|nr:carboxypeptidase-like regulatory domain-containing protein [Flavobacteriales bacterium]MBP6696728.1 carboxypeptidase-like regulatory domain-containing protein [Flavobacteriales bacterium]